MISLEEGRYKEEVYAMWQRNFHDPVPYADFYFEEVYGKNKVLLNIQEESEADEPIMMGMLHLNPYTLRIKGDSVPAHYIVGVATDEEYRRQGVMRELLIDSFQRLKKNGEAFTYLMPADENYYLPFDFRFGSCQLEQEIECFSNAISENHETNYVFQTIEKGNLSEISRIENEKKDNTFAVHTKITPEYLDRLEKETCSDFGKLLFVYRDGVYTGRFVVGAENDYMVVSQVFCGAKEMREEFLFQVLNYCEQEYHYGKYQLILDESWLDVLKKPGNYRGVRVLPVRKRPIIMFRILNLEEMGNYFTASGENHGFLRITDRCFEELEGIYEWNISEEKCTIHKCEDGQPDTDCGEISIGDLTAFLFGNKKNETLNEISGLTQKGRELLSEIHPLNLNCIQEIV